MINHRKNIKLFFVIFMILFCCFFQTIAYSAIYTTMSITGNAYARLEKDVRVTKFKLNETSLNIESSYEEFSMNTLSSKFKLLEDDSFIVFDVEITNYGSEDVGILNINGLPENLSHEVINYNLQDKLCDETNKCNQMAVKAFQIKFSGAKGEYDVNLELDFRTYNNVVYTNITNNNYPTEVIDGGNLDIKFTENLKGISVLLNDSEIEYYQEISAGQTITIPNVVGNIEIKKLEPVAKLVSGEVDQVGSEVCIKDECFYIIANDGKNLTMLSKYNLHVGNSVAIGFVITPLENPTGIQDETAIGYNVDSTGSSIYPFIGTTLFVNESQPGVTTNDYKGSVVEGYVNNYNSYLISQGITTKEARLITTDELINLGCSEVEESCSEAPRWIYSTSYWTGTNYDDYYRNVWNVDVNARLNHVRIPTDKGTVGVRPVIKMSLGYVVESFKFIIDDVAYRAEEGMTWREWIDSKYNTEDVYLDNGSLYRESYEMLVLADGGAINIDSEIDNTNTYQWRNLE